MIFRIGGSPNRARLAAEPLAKKVRRDGTAPKPMVANQYFSVAEKRLLSYEAREIFATDGLRYDIAVSGNC
jgi:hypothetical protein